MKKAKFHKYLLLMVLLLQGMSLFAQKEANIWYFGDSAGLDFNTNPPTALTNSAMDLGEGSSSISDRNGNLLFYSNGYTIWNKNHQIMTNGTTLICHYASHLSSLIIKHPGIDSLYFIFIAGFGGGPEQTTGICYSIIDMRLSGQLGAVTAKNIKIASSSVVNIAAVAHNNQRDIWVAIPSYRSDTIYTFLITPSGISSNPIINRTGQAPVRKEFCTLKFSNNATKLVLTGIGNLSNNTLVLDFNDSTGILSNTRKIYGLKTTALEFSPSSKYLYLISDRGDKNYKLYQCIIPDTSSNFGNICNEIDSFTKFTGLQLAPNGSIYLPSLSNSYLNSIKCPNNFFNTCGYTKNAVYLKEKRVNFGLTRFNQSYFSKITPVNSYSINLGNDTALCDNAILLLKAPTNYQSYLWNDLSTADSLLVSKEGLYSVTVNDSGCIAQDEIKVSYLKTPNINLGNDTSFCEGVPFYLKATNPQTNYLWSNFSTDSVIKITQSGTYWVKAYNACGSSFDTTEINVEACNCYVYVPNAFTPNGNDLNEVFLPVSNCKITNYQLIILNRWGVKIFESNNPNIGWNGKLNEILQSNDVYVYQLQADLIDNIIGTNKKQVNLKGNVTLLN